MMNNNCTKQNIIAGVIAHVDAGKTTLCEAMLYCAGSIRKLGRVDHRNCQLDSFYLERDRGITIFSKQAVLSLPHTSLTLLDTPGHVDFSAETERALSILDYAILVISGTDGVQAHTETIWRMLAHYRIPCFIFITKMDLPTCDRDALLASLNSRLSSDCLDFSAFPEELHEQLALCSEAAMEEFLQTGDISQSSVTALIKERKVFPCFFGSGLKTDGVTAFMDFIDTHTCAPEYGSSFSARCYKISRDDSGARLTHLKITGGSLSVRDSVSYSDSAGNPVTEKISRLFAVNGAKQENVPTVFPGTIAAVAGMSATYPGLSIGEDMPARSDLAEPVLEYRICLPPETDPVTALPKLVQLNEEIPELHIKGSTHTGLITVCIMGKVQAEVFTALVQDRFGWKISLDAGHVLYRETITSQVEGVGHYEPLRHYAEVHLLLEPLPRGSGIVLDTVCSEDALDRNWQRLILTHLSEKVHLGVLTGSPLTDVKITLASGRAHLKHTEGGDFREATYRAVRQGLMQADSVLLEPCYAFTLSIPTEQLGRAISDLRNMGAEFESPVTAGTASVFTGVCPVKTMAGYAVELASYTHGKGRMSFRPGGYRPCHDSAVVIAERNYQPEADLENTPDSVFCAHGGGFNVKWNLVPDYMHLESCMKKPASDASVPSPVRSVSIDDRELEAIMLREFGPIRRREYSTAAKNSAPALSQTPATAVPKRKEHLLVDGYNLIFSRPELKELAKDRLDLARRTLMDILSGYCGFTKDELVLVFDAYRVPDNPGSREEYHNIHVVYTKDGETADRYLEGLAGDIGKNYNVRVVTNDTLIRVGTMRSGILRTSCEQFWEEVTLVQQQIAALIQKSNAGAHTTKFADGIQH